MEKSLKKDIIINRLPVVIYFILIFAALMVIISAVAPMSNHEPKTTDTYSDFSILIVPTRTGLPIACWAIISSTTALNLARSFL